MYVYHSNFHCVTCAVIAYNKDYTYIVANLDQRFMFPGYNSCYPFIKDTSDLHPCFS